MDLILWRHAEAELGKDGEPDAARRLTGKGLKQAARVGEWLDHQLPDNCKIISSPAVRCVQTAEALGRKFKTDPALAAHSDAERIMETAGWPDRREPVLIVGHQPLLGQVAALIIAGEKQAWTIRKSNVLWIAQKMDETSETYIRAVISPDLITKLRA
jgi:phosphohistidine phosphatase